MPERDGGFHILVLLKTSAMKPTSPSGTSLLRDVESLLQVPLFETKLVVCKSLNQGPK